MRAAGYINGVFVVGEGAELCVENPSDGTQVDRFPGVSVSQVETAIASARRSFDQGSWSQRSLTERAGLLHQLVDKLEEGAEAVLDLLVAETGCPPHSGSMQAQFATPMKMAREIIDLMASLPETEENVLPPAEARNRLGHTITRLRP